MCSLRLAEADRRSHCISLRRRLHAQLAEYMFDTEAAMVRLDMSEYMEKVGGRRLWRGL